MMGVSIRKPVSLKKGPICADNKRLAAGDRVRVYSTRSAEELGETMPCLGTVRWIARRSLAVELLLDSGRKVCVDPLKLVHER